MPLVFGLTMIRIVKQIHIVDKQASEDDSDSEKEGNDDSLQKLINYEDILNKSLDDNLQPHNYRTNTVELSNQINQKIKQKQQLNNSSDGNLQDGLSFELEK